MIKLRSLLLEAHPPVYQGDCCTILDHGSLFNDATEMAYVDENAQQISKEDFLQQVDFTDEVPLTRDVTFFNFENRIWFAYDNRNDIHYFYAL